MHACENNTNHEFVIETFPHLMICSKSKEGTNANVIKSAQVTFGFATEAACEERKAEERKRKVRKRNIFDETVLRALPAPASFINIRLSADTYSSVRGGISLLSFPKNINLPFLNIDTTKVQIALEKSSSKI